jgi:hypothetical protein
MNVFSIIAAVEFSNTPINATVMFTSSLKPVVLMDIEVKYKMILMNNNYHNYE